MEKRSINEEEINAQIHMTCCITASDEDKEDTRNDTKIRCSTTTEDIHHKWMAKTEN